jgi:hypothetical protein
MTICVKRVDMEGKPWEKTFLRTIAMKEAFIFRFRRLVC